MAQWRKVIVSGSNAELNQISASGNIVPVTDNTQTLGTAAKPFGDLFLGSGGVINLNNGDVTLTHASNLLTITGGSTRVDKLEIDSADDHIDVSTDMVITAAQDITLTPGGANVKPGSDSAIDLGVDGLTLHPRPDHRHATSNDVINLAKIAKNRSVEFNIEGNPFSKPNNSFQGFYELVKIITPDQITLVPDNVDQITSDHGWSSGDHDIDLKNIIMKLRDVSNKSQISLFIDNLNGIEYAYEMGVDLIEIHTGEFSKGIEKNDMSVLTNIQNMINLANELGLKINAGHDLNLNNLKYLVDMGNINEVSIGHAIIVDSLNFGFETTIKKYLDIIRN